MSRKLPAGSLEAAAQSMAREISGNPDDWEKRRSALVSMQHAVDEARKSGQGGPSVFTADLWRYLKEPLKHTLNDLRSAIVKEAGVLLEMLSTAAGNLMAAFMRDVLNVLLQLLANGNSVITAQVDSCMRHVIEHTRFPRQLKEMEYMVRNSRSKDLREMVASYVRLILGTWPAASMEKEIGSLESLVSMQMADASSAARTDARASFGVFHQHWPKRAGKILKAADPRTAKTLREEYGLDEDAASTAGRRTPTKAPTRSSYRAPKPTGAGTAGGRGVETSKPFLKKGSSSSEGSARVGGGGASSGVNGNGNGNSHGQSPPSPAPTTLKSRRTVSSTSPSKAPSSSAKKKTGSSIAPPSPAASSSSTLGAAGGRRRPLHAPARASIPPTSPPAPGSSSQASRKHRFLSTPPGSSASRARPKTAGNSPLFVGSGAKARPPLIASSSAPLLVSTDGFLAGGASVLNVATSLSRGGRGRATSQDGASVSGSVVASEMGFTSLVPGDKVRLKGSSPRSATVRYVGETQFATGIWVGVELPHSAEPPGNNNGSVNGVPYFRCPPTRGIFLRADMVELEEFTDDGDSEAFAAEWCGAEGVRGHTGLADGVGATEGEKEAMSAGAELLRCHKLFTNEAMDALKDEVGVIRGLEDAVESGEAISSDRLRYFLEILESAAEAREAAASWLRAQIRQAARRHPDIFDTPIASDSLSQSLYSDHGSLSGPDCPGEKYDEEEAGEAGVAQGEEAKKDVSGGIEGQEDAIDGGDSAGDSAGAKPPGPGQEVATVIKDVLTEIERGAGDANGKGVVGLAGKLLRQVLDVPGRSERQNEVGKDGDDRAAVVSAAVEKVVVTSSPSAPDAGEAEDKDKFGEGEENNTDFDTEGDKSAGCAGVEAPPAKDVAVDM